MHVAIFGAGPAGFFAAEELLHQTGRQVTVDLFDHLPTPYGLVRGGVAPDHQHTKDVARQFEKTAARPGFRFFGNVTFGVDVSLPEVLSHYHQVLLATGAESDRHLGIPGEDLPGSHPATAFVAWFNGHPDYRDAQFDLSAERAVVVGNGNVAMDVARILIRSVDELARTDLAAHALEALRHSRITDVYLLGRRGPGQAAFSHPELHEVATLSGVDLVVRPEELEEAVAHDAYLAQQHTRHPHRNLEVLIAQSLKGEGREARKLHMRFFVSPAAILGAQRVERVRLERNHLEPDAAGNLVAKGTGVYEEIPCGLVFRSVGYKGLPLVGLPFDDRTGTIPHHDGRVVDPRTDKTMARVYVAGWIKRGPSGVIGTNRADAVASVRAMLADADADPALAILAADPAAVPAFLARTQVVTFEGWRRIDALEIAAGRERGKPRDKFTSWSDLLAAARSSGR
ncbi:MAG: FAD-dependent oxidoreductase [Vicinamibacterales bacterium]